MRALRKLGIEYNRHCMVYRVYLNHQKKVKLIAKDP